MKAGLSLSDPVSARCASHGSHSGLWLALYHPPSSFVSAQDEGSWTSPVGGMER